MDVPMTDCYADLEELRPLGEAVTTVFRLKPAEGIKFNLNALSWLD